MKYLAIFLLLDCIFICNSARTERCSEDASLIYHLNEPVELKCFETLPPIDDITSYEWTIGDLNALNEEDIKTYRILDKGTNKGDLKILDVTELKRSNDTKTATCFAKVKPSEELKSYMQYSLITGALPKVLLEINGQNPEDVTTVRKGDQINLECKALEGIPASTPELYIDGELQENPQNIDTKSFGKPRVPVRCEAKTCLKPEVNRTIHLNVEYEPEILSDSFKMDDDGMEITVDSNPLPSSANATLMTSCLPDSETIWTKSLTMTASQGWRLNVSKMIMKNESPNGCLSIVVKNNLGEDQLKISIEELVKGKGWSHWQIILFVVCVVLLLIACIVFCVLYILHKKDKLPTITVRYKPTPVGNQIGQEDT